MTHENVRLQQNNFCMGPQAGTICSIDTSNPKTVLRVKNLAGSNIISLDLSSNILNENVRVEYVGPPTLSEVRDDLTFFTFEKVSDTSCMIKRWQTRMAYNELLLKEQIVKSNTGNERYNAIDFAVEYHNRTFTRPNEYYNYLEMNSVANVKNGTRLFFGPSTDTDNEGATEVGVVSHIIDHIDGKRVYLTAPLENQYVIGDSITFYSDVYIYSSDGYAGDPNKGTLFKIDAYTWTTKEIDTKAVYKRVNAAKWCPIVGAVASIIGPNMLFVRPYDGYDNWRSMFLNNVLDDNNTIFPVHDVGFDQYSVYKLQDKTTLVDDEGEKSTYHWDEYNLQQDSILPYAQSVNLRLDQSILTGYHKNVDIYAQVRDQFNVGLRDIYLSFFKSGDTEALYDPLSGNVTTDLNGETTINYRSGSTYTGHTEITARATGGSSSVGSSYVWMSNNIISFPEFAPLNTRLQTKEYISGYANNLKSIRPTFLIVSDGDWVLPQALLFSKSYYTTPGGDWVSTIQINPQEPHYGNHESVQRLGIYLPMLYKGDDQIDSVPLPGQGFGFSGLYPWEPPPEDHPFFIGNRISLFTDIDSGINTKSLTDFLLYPDGDGAPDKGYHPYIVVLQPDETGNGQISQLKLSLHTHWVDGQPYDELWTGVDIDQFIFVEDARPKFWSYKNPIDTDIWIRLRPFAFSLDNSSLRMWVREISYIGDTGYYEVTSSIQLENFDAGGGMLGIEVTYDPPQDLKHDTIVYVAIEVYDEAAIPNFINVEYWFRVIPDYKSPYVINRDPEHGDINVPIDKTIYFELRDEGTGINRETLEILLNSRRVDDNYLTIEEVSRYYYKISYKPPAGLLYSKSYKVTVKAEDTSDRENALNTSWEFYTSDSTGVLIIDPTPGPCKAGMSRFEDVSVKVLGDGNGVDKDSIRMQVFNKDVHPRVVPIIYRIS